MINIISRINNRIKAFNKRFEKDERQLRKLAVLPRYTPGVFILNDRKLSFPDTSSFAFTYREIFKKDIYQFKTNRKEPFIIDCGANIGLSVLYFKKMFPDARIVAFEPESKIFAFLKTNTEAFTIQNLTLIKKALWKENKIISFLNEGSDSSRIVNNNEVKDDSIYGVEAVRLSEYIVSVVDFLKIDIEGAEVEVIQEIEPKLEFVERIFIEFHSFKNQKQNLDIILSILTRNNFHYHLDSPIRIANPFVYDNSFLSYDFFLNIYAIKSGLA